MGSCFEGIWVSSKNDNYDEFLKAMNISLPKRAMAKKLSTTLDIKFLGNDKFHVKSKTGPTSRDVTFEIGQDVEDKSPAGDNMKGKWEWDADVMVCDLEIADKKKNLTIRRSIEDGKLVQRMNIGGVECTRWFDKKG